MSKQTCFFTIIIVNYNGQKFLKPCLDSIKQSKFKNYQIILVDNASPDFSINTIRASKQIKILKNKTNVGFSKANNQAARLAKGQYLFFLNNDTLLHSQALTHIFSAISLRHTGIFACQLKSYDTQTLFHTGIGLDPLGFPANSNKIFYAEGSALIIKKDIFMKLGQFDPTYFMFHEDIDLSWRAWLYGYQVIPLPQAIVYHYAGGSAGGGFIGNHQNKKYKSSILRRYYSERNNIKTLIKNYRLSTLFFILPLYFFINCFEFMFFLITLQPKIIFFYFKAYAWNLFHLKNTLKTRRLIQNKRKVSDWFILSKMYLGLGKLNMLFHVGIPHFK